MSLEFPNRSRSFDETRRAVRFTGYDGMFAVAFLVEAGALVKSARPAPSEADCLTAFDAARGTILDVARKAYGGVRRPLYTLTASDFR